MNLVGKIIVGVATGFVGANLCSYLHERQSGVERPEKKCAEVDKMGSEDIGGTEDIFRRMSEVQAMIDRWRTEQKQADI